MNDKRFQPMAGLVLGAVLAFGSLPATAATQGRNAAAGLEQAARDLAAAERALARDPVAAAAFAAMVEDARARLEAGLAATAAQAAIEPSPARRREGHDDAAGSAARASTARDGAANTGLQLRRRTLPQRLVWA